MDSVFFSIIIPVYNTEKAYLDTCMASLLGQTYAAFEVILVDDGSQEMCAQMCDSYAAADPRVRVIRQENQGVSAARNRGIVEAHADWILFVDADDWVEPDMCEKLHIVLTQQDCDILMFNGIKEFAGKSTVLHTNLLEERLYDTKDVNIREMLYRKAMCPQGGDVVYYSWDKAFKRSFLLENSLAYPVGIPRSEDKVFVLSCFEKMGKLRYINDAFYHYRINAASVCHRYSEKVAHDRSLLSERLFAIATRMDMELGALKGAPDYCRITEDCYRFVFGILTDVLLLQFYHPDNPDSAKNRNCAAKELLKTEPFYSAIRKCRYGELSMEAKLKKLLLSLGLPAVFCWIQQTYKKAIGRVVSG